MTWIKTVSPQSDDEVRRATAAQRDLYPIEYAVPIHPTPDGQTSEIVASHSLIPGALHHAFATFGGPEFAHRNEFLTLLHEADIEAYERRSAATGASTSR